MKIIFKRKKFAAALLMALSLLALALGVLLFGAPAAAQAAETDYSINFEEETITIVEGYEVYTAETEGTKIESGSSITEYIGKTLYIQQTGFAERTAITIPARPQALNIAPISIDYEEEKFTPPSGTDTSNWEYSTDSAQTWNDVPDGMALSEMGWDGSAQKSYFFRIGATDISFASVSTAWCITVRARPAKPAEPKPVKVTSDSITIVIEDRQEYRIYLVNSEPGPWSTLTAATDGNYTWETLQPGTKYTIETRTKGGKDEYYVEQFASYPASITVTTERADSSLTVEPTKNTLTYGDELEIKVTPGVAAANALATAENTVELYNGDNLLASTTTANDDGSYTLTYDTKDKGLTPDQNTLIVSFGGSSSLNPSTAEVTVTLNKKQVTATAQNIITKVYDGDTDIMVPLSFADNVLVTGDNISGSVRGNFEDSNVGADKRITLETTPIWVKGSDTAQYYDIILPANVTGDIIRANIDEDITILGVAQFGETLTATYEEEDVSVSYQWKRNGENISGATSASYTLTADDVGQSITVTATATDGNHTGSVTSDPVTVGKAAGSVEISCGDVTYGTAVNPIVTSTTNEGAKVTYTYTGTDGTEYGPSETAPTDAGAYTVTATVAETATHTSATSEPVTFAISKAELATPQNLSLASTAHGKVTATWEEVQNASGYTVQLYKDGQADGTPITTTGTSCEFSIAEAGSYTVKVKANGSDNYADSQESSPSAPLYFGTVNMDTDGNGTASASVAFAAEGTEITLTANADADSHFVDWEVVCGNIKITDNKFTMPAENVEIKAVFEAHAYGQWESDGDGTHRRTCTCGDVQEGTCSGGTATCLEQAACETCGGKYGSINPDNHSGQVVWTKTATKHSAAYDCCNAPFVAEEVHEWENGICSECKYECQHSGGTATCEQKAVCSACGEEYGELAAHTPETVPGKAATCTETGLTAGSKCSVCGDILTAQSVIPAKGHTPGAEATCTEAQLCTVCGETLAEAKGHTAGAPIRENENAPTCTEEGSYDEAVYCTVCEEELSRKTVKIEAAGHSPELVAGKDATCTENGLTDGEKCSVCGETLKEQETIPALGHDFGEWTTVKEPTHSAEGEEQRICSRCGEAETRVIPAEEFPLWLILLIVLLCILLVGGAVVLIVVYQKKRRE